MPKRGLPSSTEARRVCVVCYADGLVQPFFMDLDINHAKSTDVDFDIDDLNANCPTGFDVDGDVSNFVDIKPAIEIDYPQLLDFCESNSFLYMFHASDRLLKSQIRWGNLEGFPVFKIDLSCIWGSDSVIRLDPVADSQSESLDGESLLIPCAQMKTSKMHMDTAKTPDGRILVFSRLIRYFKSRDEFDLYKAEGEVKLKNEDDGVELEYGTGLVDFELYDPKFDSWTSLPPLVLLVPAGGDKSFYLLCNEEWMKCPSSDVFFDNLFISFHKVFFEIMAVRFLNDTICVVIQMGKVLKEFTLRIDDSREGWTPCQGTIDPPNGWQGGFLVVGEERLMLTATEAKKGTQNYQLQRTLYPGPRWSVQPCGGIAVVDTQEKCVVACIVGAGKKIPSFEPCIICDLVRIDHSLEEPPLPLGTSKYRIRDAKYHRFVAQSVFPISISATEESSEEGQEKHCKITL